MRSQKPRGTTASSGGDERGVFISEASTVKPNLMPLIRHGTDVISGVENADERLISPLASVVHTHHHSRPWIDTKYSVGSNY